MKMGNMGQKSGWIISVDGGGTSTEVVLADIHGTPVGEGHSGPSNAKAVGVEAAMKSLDDGIKAAFESAGLAPEPVAVASLGLAGFDRDEDREILSKWADGGSVVQIGKLILTNDGQLVLAAGTSEGWGVGIIGGTGSIAVGKSPSGEFARAGGWGHLIGDEGSAYKLVMDTLRFIAKSVDGRMPREATSQILNQKVMHALGLTDDPNGIVSVIYQPEYDRARLASLAPSIIEAIRAEPRLIPVLLKPAGIELAEAALSVARKLQIPAGKLPVGLAGSFLLGTQEIRDALVLHLERQGYQPEIREVPRPVLGGLVLAKAAIQD
jgi:N-acetylglucosamine kinase-like BadF-type ATPase